MFTSGCTSALKIFSDCFTFCDGTNRATTHRSTDSQRRQAYFCFTEDNHTSVVGMRPIMTKKGAVCVCLLDKDVTKLGTPAACQSDVGDENENYSEQTLCICSQSSCPYGSFKAAQAKHSGAFACAHGCADSSTRECADSVQSENEFIKAISSKLKFIGDNCEQEAASYRRGEFPPQCTTTPCDSAISNRSLFIYPLQSNFNGRRYPTNWVERAHAGRVFCSDGRWFVALDAASYVATSVLDLATVQADFVALSFYKIFGFPTGLGKST